MWGIRGPEQKSSNVRKLPLSSSNDNLLSSKVVLSMGRATAIVSFGST